MIAQYNELEDLFLSLRSGQDVPSDFCLDAPKDLGAPYLLSTGSEGASHPASSGSGGQPCAKKPAKECPNAQKRFRARQKERLSSLEREVAEKKAAFNNLSHENEQLKARNSILEKVVGCRDEQLKLMQAFTDRMDAAPSAHACFGGNAAPVMTDAEKEMMRNIKKEQVIPQYKAFLAEVSSYLLHCNYPCSDPASPIVQKVTSCVERMGGTLKQIMLMNESLLRQLLSLNLETLQPASAPESHWDDVVLALQLQPEQRSDILAVFDLYKVLASKVYEERKLIMAALGEGCGTLDAASGSFVARNGMAGEMELVDRLNANLAKEHAAHTLLCCFFFGKVLAAPQFAKVAVYAYPFFPDSLAVAAAVQRQAHSLARCAGSGSGSGTFSHDSGSGKYSR